MKRKRGVVSAAACGTVAVIGWIAAGTAGLGTLTLESTQTPNEVSQTTSATASAEQVDIPQAITLAEGGACVANTESGIAALSEPRQMPVLASALLASLKTSDPVQNDAREATGSIGVAEKANGSSGALAAAPPVLSAAVSTVDPGRDTGKSALSSKAPDACPEPDVCIDQYLWTLYERTPKVDTVKVEERIKVKVKKKGKTRTVVKTLVKYVTEDFAWKDPKAAQKAGMSLKDYVIGGMDKDFRRKLYDALHAMETAGFSPGITSAFRDDYRQEIATGNKAAADSSYHGGSRRGGYGHGLAADLVSLKGGTRAERCTWSDVLWKWIDAHEKELGIGRPYLDKDPPHVAPVDGKEYADKRGLAKARLAGVKRPSLSSNMK
jgi:hypothetical protein